MKSSERYDRVEKQRVRSPSSTEIVTTHSELTMINCGVKVVKTCGNLLDPVQKSLIGLTQCNRANPVH